MVALCIFGELIITPPFIGETIGAPKEHPCLTRHITIYVYIYGITIFLQCVIEPAERLFTLLRYNWKFELCQKAYHLFV